MAKIAWEAWLEYRRLLDEAPTTEKQEEIKAAYRKKYGDGVDPGDDTVMVAGK
jgi:hypothetical protein